MGDYNPWKSQAQQPEPIYEDIQRGPRAARSAQPTPVPYNPQPYNMSGSTTPSRAFDAAPGYPRSPSRGAGDQSSAVSAPRRRSMDSRSPRAWAGQASPGMNDEKAALRHQNSTGTLAEEPILGYGEKGWKPGHATRGSMAVQMAATGEIPKKAGLRLWRSEEHSGTFLRGGKRRACLRCCICSFILAIVIIIAVIVAFLLWVRPPSVTFQGVETPAGITEVVVITGGFQLNFNLLVGVINPNYFGAFFPSIQASAFYPGDNTALGGGQMINVNIHKRTNNTIHFPFQINYTSAIDPNAVILTDIAQKCGFIQGSTPGPIKVNYSLDLKIRVLAVDITPSFSSSTTFACPLQESDIDSLLKAGGVQGIISETGGTTNSASGNGGDRKRDLEDMMHGLAERTTDKSLAVRRLDAAPMERALAAL